MNPKEYLKQMVNHTITGDMEAAKNAFQQYIVPKTIEVLGVNRTAKTEPEPVLDTEKDT